MNSNAVQGLADSFSLLDGLPKAAELEAARDIYEIGKLVVVAQQAATPEQTGALKAGLTVQVLIGQLRARAGLLGMAATSRSSARRSRRDGKARFILGDLFYGLFVRYGRKEQVVLVQRRRRVAANIGGGLTANILRTSSGRKRAEDIAGTYPMQVQAMEGRDFIDVLDSDASLDAAVTARLATFWGRTLKDVGADE